MLRCLPSRRSLRCVPGAALSLALVSLSAAPAAAQFTSPKPPVERYGDPVGNGIAIGGALGAIGGLVATGALYAPCNGLCDVPETWHVYAMYGAAGAGIGAGTGWLIDRLHKGRPPAAPAHQLSGSPSAVLESAPDDRDPSWDGMTKGALIGAGAMAGFLAVNYARCDAGCEAPAEGPMYAWGLSIGAGGGAAAGWLIDRLHVARKPVPIAVAVRADKQARAVRVQWRF
jgi:hypothetical protein